MQSRTEKSRVGIGIVIVFRLRVCDEHMIAKAWDSSVGRAADCRSAGHLFESGYPESKLQNENSIQSWFYKI